MREVLLRTFTVYEILKSCDVTQTFFFYMLAFLKLDSGKLLVLVRLKGPLSLNMIETVVT